MRFSEVAIVADVGLPVFHHGIASFRASSTAPWPSRRTDISWTSDPFRPASLDSTARERNEFGACEHGSPGADRSPGSSGRSRLLVRWIRASMRTLAGTPEQQP